MSTHTRTTKSNGTTEWANGEVILHSEHNDEWNQFLTDYNGGITNDNISGSAAIANSKLADIAMSKVLDYADDIATYKTTATPGDTGSPSLPTTLQAEMTRLRYRLDALKRYSTNVYYMNSSGTATAAAWFEPILVGRNLIPNPGFEVHSAGTPNAPDGWSLVSTPATVAIENPAYTSVGLEKRSLNIVTNGANEGISCTIAGLRASTKYLVGMTYTLTDNGTVAGVLRLSTTNGLGSGDYQNLTLDTSTEAAATVATVQGIVKSTSTPDSITVSITGTTAGADFNLIDVWMYEISDGKPSDLPHIPMQTVSLTTEDTAVPASFVANPGGNGNFTFETYSSFNLSQYIPFRGYALVYEVDLSFVANSGQQAVFSFEIQENVDGGGAATVEGPYTYVSDDNGNTHQSGQTIKLRFRRENPTPGSTYAYTTRIGAFGNGVNYVDMTLSPKVGDTAGSEGTDYKQMSSRARLIMERL